MCGPSAPAMDIQGIGRSGAHDGPEEHWDTAETSGGTHDDLEAPEDPLDIAVTPATLRRRGGFDFDQEWGLYPLQWDDMDDFEAWCWEEELAYTIEILASSQYYGGPTSLWTLHCVFVCGREYAGGKQNYVRKCPEQQQKVLSKKLGVISGS
jgi:hypothetical protein